MYEGICKFCGQTQSIMAESQEEADAIAAERCVCDGASFEQRKEMLFANIDEIAGAGAAGYEMKPLPFDVQDRLKDLGVLVMQGQVQTVSLNVDGTVVKISINSKGQVKVIRREQKNIGAEC